jgi:hypothetical protein
VDYNKDDLDRLRESNPEMFEKIAREGKSQREEQAFSLKGIKTIPDSPIELDTPKNFQIYDDGIYEWITKKEESFMVCICRVPVLLSKRLRSIDTGHEKIEICFKRDSKWHYEAFDRSTVFTTRSITMLADYGLTVTSENAKSIVKFLGALEASNLEKIPICKCTSQLGWYGKNFIPFQGDILVDVDKSTRRWIDSYSPAGTLQEWVDFMKPLRKNLFFKFILATGFAAPLLNILGHRVFFVHIWGDSRGGKTAALKAALSAWGDPEGLMVTFNATNVGMERLAGLFNDLPMGIDEEQTIDQKSGGSRGKDNKRSFVDTLIYILSMGVGKIRGNKSGGLQTYRTWRTIAMTTGEEPLSSVSSNTGVRTRVLDINSLPFGEGAEMLARKCHQTVKDIHGTAGPEYIKRLSDLDKTELKDIFEKFCEGFSAVYPQKIQSHISSVSLVCTANYLIELWLFDGEKEAAQQGSIEVGRLILDRLDDVKDADVVERAYEFTKNWVVQNGPKFTSECTPPRYGYTSKSLDERGEYVYIFPAALRKALEDEGYGYRKVIKGFAQKGYIDSTGKEDTFQLVKKIEGKSIRLVKLNFVEEKDQIEIDDFFEGL